jgi:peptidoglycan hydrolase CwlO-like protein
MLTGGVCLFNCPIVLYKQKKIMALTALRDIVNELRHQIERLDEAIEDTQKEIDDLKIISTRLVLI